MLSLPDGRSGEGRSDQARVAESNCWESIVATGITNHHLPDFGFADAAPLAFGIISRALTFEYRNAAMVRLCVAPDPGSVIKPSLRGALPKLAPSLEEASAKVMRSRIPYLTIPVLRENSPDGGCYVAYVFPMACGSRLHAGVVIADVTCYTVELLSSVLLLALGELTDTLTPANERRIKARLPAEADDQQARLQGLVFRCEQVSAAIRRSLQPAREAALTQRETEVLALVAQGKSSRGVAQVLGISEKTVRTHRDRIMQKLDMHDVAALARYAIRHGSYPAQISPRSHPNANLRLLPHHCRTSALYGIVHSLRTRQTVVVRPPCTSQCFHATESSTTRRAARLAALSTCSVASHSPPPRPRPSRFGKTSRSFLNGRWMTGLGSRCTGRCTATLL